jgi:hypothetical protein
MDHEGQGEICRHEAEIRSLRPPVPLRPTLQVRKKDPYLFGCESLWPENSSRGGEAHRTMRKGGMPQITSPIGASELLIAVFGRGSER